MRLCRQCWRDRAGAKHETAGWYVELKDHLGIFRRLPAFGDRAASEEYGRKLERLISLQVAGLEAGPDLTHWLEGLPAKQYERLAAIGLLDGFRFAATKPLEEHLADWRTALEAKGNTPAHCRLFYYRANTVFAACGFKRWKDVEPQAVRNHLAGLRERGEISALTLNLYLVCIKGFCRWMVRERRAVQNPLEALRPLAAKTVAQESRHVRRAFTVDELRRLLAAAEAAPERFGMTGPARALLYRLAVETGLRAGELRTLTRGSFQVGGGLATVCLEAGAAKNAKAARLPLRAETVAILSEYLANKLPTAPAFNLPAKWDMVDMLRADMAAAEIRESDGGGVLDFHSLRHTFLTMLANSGVHPKVAQDLARHSDINLTLSRYSHTVLEQRAEAVDRLPALDVSAEAGMKTGTAGEELTYRKSYREGAASATCKVNADGRSRYEDGCATLAQPVERRFRKA